MDYETFRFKYWNTIRYPEYYGKIEAYDIWKERLNNLEIDRLCPRIFIKNKTPNEYQKQLGMSLVGRI